jgi:RNA polymerase sigma-70 factor (ECF subfamily)
MTQYLDDKLIISNLKEGDVLSFDYIFKKCHKKVYYFAVSYLKNKEEAEDVVQEVFMNLWKFRDQINADYIFSKYLFKITYNATCKKFRKQASGKKQLEAARKNIFLEDNSTNLEVEYNNLLENANTLINKLPYKQKNVLILSTRGQLTIEEIARKLSISIKTVENYLTMAKTSLRKLLFDGQIVSILVLLFLLDNGN